MSAARTLRNHNPAQMHARPFGRLDAVNEALVKENLHLHPTQGFRTLSVKRTLISDLTARKVWGNVPLMKAVLQRRVFI